MLGTAKIVAFMAVRDHHRAREFYETALGLPWVKENESAAEFDANGIMQRVATVLEFQSASFTVLGWQVRDIKASVRDLERRGVRFQRYSGLQQDAQAIWTSPANAKVAWFKDPDGNLLSLTEFA